MCKAQQDKGETVEPGIHGQDFLEHFSVSTQGCLFSLIHWGTSLPSSKARKSALDLFESMIDTAMGKDKHVMALSTEAPVGSLPSDGAYVPVQHGCITDCKSLGNELPTVKKALNRTCRFNIVS